MPNPDRLAITLTKAIDAFRNTHGRRGRLVTLTDAEDVVVCGDLHGNVANFRAVMECAHLDVYPKRHLILQEVVHSPFRYPLGGDKSHQLLDLTAALKCKYPQRVHFLVGNHELCQWQDQRIGKGDVEPNDLFRAGVEGAYGHHADRIYGLYMELLAVANFAVRLPNRVFLSHSLPASKHLDSFQLKVLENDHLSNSEVQLGGTLHSLVWGRDTSPENVAAFLAKVDADWLITGHIPCDKGFALPNDQQLILDSQAAPACYCVVPATRVLTQHDLLCGVGTLV